MSRLEEWSRNKWTKFVNSGKIGKAPSGNGYGLGIQDFFLLIVL